MSQKNEKFEDKLKTAPLEDLIQYRGIARVMYFLGHTVGLFSGVIFAFGWPLFWPVIISSIGLLICGWWVEMFDSFLIVVQDTMDIRFPGWEYK